MNGEMGVMGVMGGGVDVSCNGDDTGAINRAPTQHARLCLGQLDRVSRRARIALSHDSGLDTFRMAIKQRHETVAVEEEVLLPDNVQ
jgi:hypothetical protein